MGYACPVCETPQRDGEHLANHLAFTAMLGDQAHEDWLDYHAPEWGEASPEELADQVVEHAPETEYEDVFEDTVDRRDHSHRDPNKHGSDVDHGSELGQDRGRPNVDPAAARSRGSGSLDSEAQDILREAEEMTQELLDDGDDEDSSEESDLADEGKES
jgi:hypothetical protein